MNSNTQPMSQPQSREDFSDYVAHLHVHMGLQSRKLTRPLVYGGDSCDKLLEQTQASIEKQASRNS
ncbi:hypothetical protein IQ266_13815 [filamentous cyanobacterium LEGE 11480]|uniref:Uncharacterized protein n=1 Tax=Romeriopsis navalis LEGE 11480 TaxID=2777977 RepID=A0A928VLI3_9CYAN|nr:hypothetical protein [Romeriopsis navalis]MBE9030808.1 hypothetical protein [Romeriopsis navalis LEGE 11480]